MEDRRIYLVQSQLDNTYQHTPNFRNRDEQFNWFLKSKHLPLNVNVKSDSFREKVVIKENIDNLLEYDYLIITGYPHHFYYFILAKTQETKSTTLLTLELDVIQTYMPNLSFKFQNSFVERCHVPRWTEDGQHMLIDANIQDEGIDYGSLIAETTKTLYSTPGAYIICSTSPLGEIPKGGGSSESEDNGNVEHDKENSQNGYGKPVDGKVSNKFVVFIKSWEGFSSTVYQQPGDVPTIGYGTTTYDPDAFAQLKPKCTEKQATIVLIDKLNSDYAKQVRNKMKRDGIDLSKVKSNHFDAFVDLCYNGGLGAVTKSPMYERFKNNPKGDPKTIAEGWEHWWIRDGNGTVLQGLINRRNAEKDIFINGNYGDRKIQNLSEGGYVSGTGYLPSTSTEERGMKIVRSAEKLLGKPYRWGGNYPPLGRDDGTDCSGLMQWAYNDNGIKISRTTYTQVKDGKPVTDATKCKPGDLILMYPSSPGVYEHVVMFKSYNSDGNALCVEAQKTGTLIHHRNFTLDLSKMAIRRIL